MTRAHALALVASLAAMALPFFVVRFVPSTDLPQHVAQARLFWETISDPHTSYRIQWLTPYGLTYLPFVILWKLLPPILVGKIGLLLLALGSVVVIHWLAARRDRPTLAACLACLLLFSVPLYWGFLSFFAGAPLFLVWVQLVARRPGARRTAGMIALLVIIYLTHALWFGAALAWLGVRSVVRLVGRREKLVSLLIPLAATAPLVLFAALRVHQFENPRFNLRADWVDWSTRGRDVVDSMFGGLRGPTEPLVAGLLAAWVLAGVWQARKELRARLDLELLGAAALLVLFYAVLPGRWLDTIFFARRFLPMAVVLILLGAPAPSLRSARLRAVLVLAVVAAFSLVTASAWRAFEREDLDGLDATLAALPQRPGRVVGLDLLHGSETIGGRPFLQLFAYAQVVTGADLSFSFAEHPASLVVNGPSWKPPAWTPELEWFASELTPRDFQFFDYAMVNGDDKLHDLWARLPVVTPITHAGRWRLYGIQR